MFIDTNVFVYSRTPEDPHHDAAREQLELALQSGEALRISRQVLREYLAVVTRPQAWSIAMSREEALAGVEQMMTGCDVLEDGPHVTAVLLQLCREVAVGGRQIHDANIVATMLAHGERRLLTFNAADFRRYGDRIELVGE